MRTLPLVPFVNERLLELKAEQEENRRLCGRSYVKDYTGYVCINEIGDIINLIMFPADSRSFWRNTDCAECAITI